MKENAIKIDNYGCLTIPTPKPLDSNLKLRRTHSLSFVYPSNDDNSRNKCTKQEDNYDPFLTTELYFTLNCTKNKDGTRSLILNGKDLQSKIGRRFKNWDVPYLILFLPKLNNVTKLILPNNDIDSAGFINIINFITLNDQIEELDLRGNNIGNPGINFMFHKKHLIKLKVLRLSGNKVGSKNSKKIAIIVARNLHIQHLEVADMDQTESSLIYFASILRGSYSYPPNMTLKILDLSRPISHNKYSKLETDHLATVIGLMLRYNNVLEELHLQKFNFYCHDIEEIVNNAKYNKTLRILDLNCNNIGDHGVEMLSQWLQLRPELRALLLGHNVISDHGISFLSRGIPFSKLTVLYVSYNRFTDCGAVDLLNSLKKVPMMEHLRISGNKLGHATAKIVERMVQSFINQEFIDVRTYIIDGKLDIASYPSKQYKRSKLLSNFYKSCD